MFCCFLLFWRNFLLSTADGRFMLDMFNPGSLSSQSKNTDRFMQDMLNSGSLSSKPPSTDFLSSFRPDLEILEGFPIS